MASNDAQQVSPTSSTRTPWLEVGDEAVLVRQAIAVEALFEGESPEQNRPGVVVDIDGVFNDTHTPYTQRFLLNRQEAYELFRGLRETFSRH